MWKVITVFLLTFFSAAAQQDPSQAPAGLRPPSGQRLLFQAHGVGDQIYTCKNTATGFAWTLMSPDARLLGPHGELLGRHFAGPTWEAKDGSSITAKPAAHVESPNPDSIPALLLTVTAHSGHGTLEHVEAIQRLNTKGGVAPRSGCDAQAADTERRAPYEADYYFNGPPR
jgi:Protein of unknown function (DUF3455)